MKIVSVKQMRELEKRTISQYGIPGEVLMERAGEGIFRFIKKRLLQNKNMGTPVFFAGRGNNGGDAFVAARLLRTNGIACEVYYLAGKSEMTPDTALNFRRLSALRCKIKQIKSESDISAINLLDNALVIDSLLGTGLKGPAEGLSAKLIERINALKTEEIIAIDIPSGLNGDTGKAEGPAIVAEYTLTMGLPKAGLIKNEGLNYSGWIEVVDIGIPQVLVDGIKIKEFFLTEKDIPRLSKRKRISHKGDYGHVYIVGGSAGLTGAPCLAALGSLHSGAGLVTVGVPASLSQIFEIKLTEAMKSPLPAQNGALAASSASRILKELENKDVLVIGPGFARNRAQKSLLEELLPKIEVPVVIDADALFVLSDRKDLLKEIKTEVVITPHPGEMARLVSESSGHVQSNRWDIARAFAQEYGVIVVLKGAGTIIADPGGNIFINSTGNPGMAAGGTGDVLAGMIGSFMSQKYPAIDAAKIAVYHHGKTADAISRETKKRVILPGDIIKRINIS